MHLCRIPKERRFIHKGEDRFSFPCHGVDCQVGEKELSARLNLIPKHLKLTCKTTLCISHVDNDCRIRSGLRRAEIIAALAALAVNGNGSAHEPMGGDD